MEVDLDREVPLFRHLAGLCARVEQRGRPLRLVGGAAMLLWGRHLSRPRDMTEDIDCAWLASDLPDEAAAERLAREVVEDLRQLGFTRPDDWKASRKARFSYDHSTDRVAVDLLCGDLPVGEASRRRPAWRIASIPDGPPDFYAARVAWLDLVREWITVRTSCGELLVTPQVPDLSGLAILKLRAVTDKVRRLVTETDAAMLALERLRLARHATDCMLLFDWIDARGEFDRLARLAAEHRAIRTTAREGARWALTGSPRVAGLDVARLGRALERVVPAGS